MKNKQWYLILGVWIFLNFLALMVSNCTWDKGMHYPKEFFPFCGYPDYFYPRERTVWKLLKMTYSYSEFFVYTVPAFIALFFIGKSQYELVERDNVHFEPAVKPDSPNIDVYTAGKSGVLSNKFRIMTTTPGLSVYIIRNRNGVGMPDFIGKTPLILDRTIYVGHKLTISHGDLHKTIIVDDSAEFFVDL